MKDDVFTLTDLKAASLAAAGAVLFVATDGGWLPFLVGAWSRIDARRSFWFAAGGDDQSAAHVLEYDVATAPHVHAVEFRQGGKLIAYLTTVAESELANEDEMKQQFAAWQRHLLNLPRVRDFIADQRELLSGNSR